MNSNELAAQIARRFPKFSRRDIHEVMEVMIELCNDELCKQHGEVHFSGLGKLYVETHEVVVSGIVRTVLASKYGNTAPSLIMRRTVRFRASESLRIALSDSSRVNHE